MLPSSDSEVVKWSFIWSFYFFLTFLPAISGTSIPWNLHEIKVNWNGPFSNSLGLPSLLLNYLYYRFRCSFNGTSIARCAFLSLKYQAMVAICEEIVVDTLGYPCMDSEVVTFLQNGSTMTASERVSCEAELVGEMPVECLLSRSVRKYWS